MVFLDCFFFFNDTATTDIYTYRHTLSLHDALPILTTSTDAGALRTRVSTVLPSSRRPGVPLASPSTIRSLSLRPATSRITSAGSPFPKRSEEHTSELQSLMRISYAVFCLEKKQLTHSNNQHH